MFRHELLETLHCGLIEMGQILDKKRELKLIYYIELISAWNKALRLSSVCDLHTMISRHLLDSLSILTYIKSHRVIDIGAGAGLPGIPLAIAMPDHYFYLLDSSHKKAIFLEKVLEKLSLRNIEIVNQSIEEFNTEKLFDTVISRAFSTLDNFVNLSKKLIKPGGQILAMKGVYPFTELQALPTDFKVVDIHPLKIPNLSAERHVVEMVYQPEVVAIS
jgi:16S rRNA (guanine527-N7)-methyltransferase